MKKITIYFILLLCFISVRALSQEFLPVQPLVPVIRLRLLLMLPESISLIRIPSVASFTKKYNTNATLDDLARELMLSHKQTEREVKRFTGNTFVREISKRKIEAAIMLSQTTKLSLTEISKLVGYTSYCGFYKAYKNMFHNSPNHNH